MNRYRRLLPYITRQWPALTGIGILTILSSALTALQPWPLKVLIDHALKHADIPPPLQSTLDTVGLNPTPLVLIVVAATASLIVFALNSFFDVILTWNWTLAGQRMVRNLAHDLFHRLQHLSPRFHQKHPTGDLLDRLTTDTWCVYKLTDGLLISPVQRVVTLAGLGFVAWQLHAQLAACALATAPLMAVATVYFGKRIRHRARLGREAQSRLLSFVHQTLSSVPIVQAFATEDRNHRHFQHLAADTVAHSQRRALTTSGYGLATGLITTSGTALIVFLGARHVLAGTLTLGSFIVFLAYMRTLQTTAEGLIKLYGTLKPTEASIDRVLEILDAPDNTVQDSPNAQPLRPQPGAAPGHLLLDNVTFSYEPGRPVLKKIHLEIHPGETIALVGPTGAGKTSLASLIPRFYDPCEGRILFDGTDLRHLQLKSLRAHVSLVQQDSFLLPISIAENIAYGRPSASRDQIIAAAQAAHCHELISALPQGYDTILSERGVNLSGGERQRLSIARAILKDAPVLILDEPTSALDARTEHHLLNALENLTRNRTSIVIAHRLSTIRRADRIVFLRAGRIIECGTHDALLKTGGPYAQLHAAHHAPRAPQEVPA